MKPFIIFLLLVPLAAHAQKLSYTLTPKNPNEIPSTVLVVSNKVPIEGAVPKIISALKERGHIVLLSKEEIKLDGLSLKNSPFAPEIKYALAFNVLNQNVGEAVIDMEVVHYNLTEGSQKGMRLTQARDNINMIASEIAKFMDGNKPKAPPLEAPEFTEAAKGEAAFPAEAFPALRKGDEFFVRFTEPRGELLEIKAQVKRIETATNAEGVFVKKVVVDDKKGLIKKGDKILKTAPQRNRFSLNLSGTAAVSKVKTLRAFQGGAEYAGQKLWGGGFMIQGEYERFLPYGFTSSTSFGLNIDGTINTYILTGVGWRWINPLWELIPSIRFGLAFVPLAFSGAEDALQGSGLRFGMDVGLSFLYHVANNFSVGFEVGLQYWFYSLGVLYKGADKVSASYEGGGMIPLPYLYPRLGLKLAWKF